MAVGDNRSNQSTGIAVSAKHASEYRRLQAKRSNSASAAVMAAPVAALGAIHAATASKGQHPEFGAAAAAVGGAATAYAIHKNRQAKKAQAAIPTHVVALDHGRITHTTDVNKKGYPVGARKLETVQEFPRTAPHGRVSRRIPPTHTSRGS